MLRHSGHHVAMKYNTIGLSFIVMQSYIPSIQIFQGKIGGTVIMISLAPPCPSAIFWMGKNMMILQTRMRLKSHRRDIFIISLYF